MAGGCCGKKPVGVVSRNQAFTTAVVADVGLEGTMLTYSGTRSSGESFTVYGFYTGTPYRITPGKNFRADNRDLVSRNPRKPGLLEMYEANKPMFKEVPVMDIRVEELQPMTAAVIQDFSPAPSIVEPEFISDIVVDPSVLDGTVPLFDRALTTNNYTNDQLEILLAYEIVNKNRKTVIALIEGKLYGEAV